MNEVRQLWFESHLLSNATGRVARRRCEALGPARHAAILACGDRLARVSIAAAQNFYRQAAAAHDHFGRRFDEWVQTGVRIAGAETPLRELAVAYFSIEAGRAHQVGLEGLRAWAAIARRLAGTSRKLAATFCETTAPLIGEIGVAVLERWAIAGLSLHAEHGWHGEFLAQAYFANAPLALRVLSPGQFELWAKLGALLRPVARGAEFYAALPKALRGWSDDERGMYLETARGLGATVPAAGLAFYRDGAVGLRELPGGLRVPLLRACRLAAPDAAAALGALVPVLGAMLLVLPLEQRALAAELAERVAKRFPQGVPPLLRSVAIAFEEADSEGVRGWVDRGLAVAAASPEAGLAYFGLESRTSVKVLRAASTAVMLEEVQGVLRKVIQMLSGQAVVVRSAGAFRLRSPLEEFPAENEVALPLKVDWLDTHEDNERLYRVLAAALAGRREFGTYDVEVRGDGGGDAAGSLVRYLRSDEQPQVLEDLFTVADGYRVACRTIASYPGLAAEFRWSGMQVLAHWLAATEPDAQAVFDCVLALALVRSWAPARVPQWLKAVGNIMLPCLWPLGEPAASAADALAVAERLAGQLGRLVEARSEEEEYYDELVLERAAGDALVGSYLQDDTPAVQAPPLAPEPDAASGAAEVSEDERLRLRLSGEEAAGASRPLSLEELRRLLESGVKIDIDQGGGEEVDGLGLYITDLIGKVPVEQLEDLRRRLGETDRGRARPPQGWLERRSDAPCFLYDEWDYHIGDYRSRWCRLREVDIEGDSGAFFNDALMEYAVILPEIRRQFQRIRPDMYRVVRGLEDGEDFDLNAAISARVDIRARRSPSSKLYVARRRQERDVATLFLIDMSASTDEPVARLAAPAPVSGAAGGSREGVPKEGRRIIDITKEALVVMTEALEEIGDAYAIYGFSGHGRDNVEFYLAKSFTEPLSANVKSRIGAIEPKRSTRMGTALRHAVEKMSAIGAASKHLILLSDGFPQDFDYGQDRRSNVYGIRDTTMALREAEAAGITPFCITVDKGGHDYLREMCDSSRYMVIEDIAALPSELPKIYQRVVGIG